MSIHIPIHWPEDTAWLPIAIYEVVHDSVDAMAPDAEVHFYNSDDDDHDEPLDRVEPACGVEIVQPILSNKPSIKIILRYEMHGIAMGPLWSVRSRHATCCWKRTLDKDDSGQFRHEFTNELNRWLEGHVVVYYIFRGSKLIGCQLNNINTIIGSSWKKRLGSSKGVFIVKNDPRGVDGFDITQAGSVQYAT